jgi:hypothetical protein
MAALLGAQTPETENTLLKRMPSAASREMLGVTMVESPKDGITGLISSATSQTMFGWSLFVEVQELKTSGINKLKSTIRNFIPLLL